MFVPATPGSVLMKKYKNEVQKSGIKIRIVEKAGISLKQQLQRSDPFKLFDLVPWRIHVQYIPFKMFELFTEMHLPTKDIYTHNLVLLVLGTTVNCLAVWVDGVFGSFACPVDILYNIAFVMVSLKGIISFCVLLLLFVSQLCSDTFPFAKQVCDNGCP